ncbi:MAG: hypothetical protein JRI52_09540, partial [Deltaproteobacteria bacterium]|nr:hypothetical protein [Deltaproteobacteria bacterium]
EVSEHEKLLKDLQNTFPHSIVKSTLYDINQLLIIDYNCFEYVFDLIYSETYKATLEYQQGWKINPIGADKKFVEYLLARRGLYEVEFEGAKNDYIIIYFNESEPTHAGKILRKRVVSKWGKGLLLEHEIYEAPAIYGNEVKFFKNLFSDNCINTFIEYAESNGIEFTT